MCVYLASPPGIDRVGVGVPGSRIDPGRGLALFVCFLLISIDISFYIYWVTRRSIYRLVDWIRVFVNADTID